MHRLALIIIALFFFSCGDKEDDPALVFTCSEDDTLKCEKNGEYCLQVFDEETELEASCHPVPDGCEDCDCIQEDQPVVDSCGGFTVCTSLSTSVYSVDCSMPDAEN